MSFEHISSLISWQSWANREAFAITLIFPDVGRSFVQARKFYKADLNSLLANVEVHFSLYAIFSILIWAFA